MQERPLLIMLAPQAWNRTSRNMKVRVKIHKNDWTGARRSKLKSMSDLTCQEIHMPPWAMLHLMRSIPRHGEAPWEIQDYTSKAHLMSTIRILASIIQTWILVLPMCQGRNGFDVYSFLNSWTYEMSSPRIRRTPTRVVSHLILHLWLHVSAKINNWAMPRKMPTWSEKHMAQCCLADFLRGNNILSNKQHMKKDHSRPLASAPRQLWRANTDNATTPTRTLVSTTNQKNK